MVNTSTTIGVHPFLLNKISVAATSSKFAFEAMTTKQNLMKLLRAYSLGKPILIEGPPGVGKTALVENLARETGRTLVRVNLSEQTDMMDLLGSEYPTSGDHADEDDI
jgi:midasin